MSLLFKRLLIALNITFITFFIVVAFLCISGTITVTFASRVQGNIDVLQKNIHRRCSLFYLKTSGVEKEEANLVWAPDRPGANIQVLLNAWCDGALRDGLISQKTAIESATYNQESGEVILSLTGSLCDSNADIKAKVFLIESMLKTLRQTGIFIRSVMFLVHQQPLKDRDLDFSCFWPIEGFIEK